MADKIGGVDPNLTNPNNPGRDQAPVDPSNTSSVGQKVEQGVVDPKAGISEQSSKWEDTQERSIPENSNAGRSENYIKDPSPEENNIESDQ
ncbi:hypothetical protein [Segetibacter aerophilus]|uniref:Uncharacterized protein n=1 Tax=Segetibacter aerophilus TaxID=670293 RepID=A0A512BC49_9BACT|nr:hypothetical protein [Segetibacter aerophilus]GEO09549.1 hypothetical protein SAE01_20450 [Segetibacter aerophilus]